MEVEAARLAVTSGRPVAEQLLSTTTSPAHQDKTNATTIHAALGLLQRVGASDIVWLMRSAVATLVSAIRGSAAVPTLAVISEIGTGLAGRAD